MDLIEFVFWISLGIIIYTYLGYGIVLYLLVKIKRIVKPAIKNYYAFNELPELTLIVACYNEADILDEKVKNTLELSYPEDKLNLYFVTDGSTDNSSEVLGKYERIRVFHTDKRGGKVAAVNRVMEFVTTPLVAFCDANTFLNAEAMVHLARHYKNSAVGAVAGEKKIYQGDKEHAAGSGEGAYWKYESFLKRMDSELGTVVGAAGELFSVRTDLYEMVPKNIIIEDFYLSMRIVVKGYKVVYEPDAYAMETGSASTKEEEKKENPYRRRWYPIHYQTGRFIKFFQIWHSYLSICIPQGTSMDLNTIIITCSDCFELSPAGLTSPLPSLIRGTAGFLYPFSARLCAAWSKSKI